MKNVKAPCPACPFSRSVKPGALGGSSPTTYIGQAVGPFMLPCHQACNFDDPDWKGKVMSTPQCAGAAIFRANIGVADLLPEAIYRLPADTSKVFASTTEFLAHHTQTPLSYAHAFLMLKPPVFWLQQEMQKQEARVYYPEN